MNSQVTSKGAGRKPAGYHIQEAVKAQGQHPTLKDDRLTHPPEAPPGLSKYERGWFNYYCELKIIEEDLRQQWIPLITLLCNHHQAEAELKDALSIGEIIIVGDKGMKNPARERLLSVRKEILQCLGSLRLTPKSTHNAVRDANAKKSFTLMMPRSRPLDN